MPSTANAGSRPCAPNPDAPKHAGITTVVIDMQAEGVEVRPLREATGAAMFNEVFFDHVFVPDDDVVGAVDNGWTVARSTLGNERVSIGGGGGAAWAVDVVDLLRRHGGDDHVRRGRGRARGRGRGDAGAEPPARRARGRRRRARARGQRHQAALGASTHSGRPTSRCSWSGPAAVLADDDGQAVGHAVIFTRALSIAGGTSEITRNQIGERILGLPRDPLIN